MAAPFFGGFGPGLIEGLQAAQGLQRGQQEKQYNELLRREMLAKMAQEQRQQQISALIGQQLAGAFQQRGQAAQAGVGAPPAMAPPQQLPQMPGPTGSMASAGVAPPWLKQQVLGLEGNQPFAVGRAGELGPGQIKPSTGAEYGFQPSQLLGQSGRAASGRIVDDLYRRSGGDPRATEVGYNAGAGAMQRYQAAGDNLAAVPKLAPAYRKAISGLSPEQQGQTSNIAVQAAGMLPPGMVGNAPPSIITRLVERVAGSDAPDEIKGAALIQLLPLMSQEGKQQFQQMFDIWKTRAGLSERQQEHAEHEQDVTLGREQTRELSEERMALQREMAGLSPEGQQGAQPASQLPQNWEGKPDKAPPGVDQSLWDAALGFVQTGTIPSASWGGQAIRNQIRQLEPAAREALGIKPTQMARQWATYGGQKHAEFALGTRIANLSTSIFEAQKAAKPLLSISSKVGRLDLGPFFNRWVTGGKLQSGDPNIVEFQARLNAFLNMYARGINPTGRLTDQQQSHAYETLSIAMSDGQIQRGVDALVNELEIMKSGLGEAVQAVPGYFEQNPDQPQPPGRPPLSTFDRP